MHLSMPKSYYNTLSYIGSLIAAISFFMFVFLYVLGSLARFEQPYVGLVIFIIIPMFIIIGLALIPIGMLRKIVLTRKGQEEKAFRLPVVDLNDRHQRNSILIFTVGTCMFLFLSALGSYKAYHYTESVDFCGRVCHNIMIPEFTAYHFSPHARVTCAECHVGTGANWYVKSKLSGLYQVYATLAHKYPRPIPTPVENLRPARETCEECHWPQKVYGKQQRMEIYYLPDEQNSRCQVEMLMNTGGGNPALGQMSGIHWHINSDIQIEYKTNDPKRLAIPRVILTNRKTGAVTVYNSTEESLDEAKAVETRNMDCIDCHNRPSHIYRDPSKFINDAMAAGDIDASLPFIKKVATEACMEEYESTEAARQAISEKINRYYQDNYPALMTAQNRKIAIAITSVQTAFSQNIFPEMKVRWEFYPDHIGHMTNAGCFRCHDNQHVSKDGRVISQDCNTCHTIISQEKAGTAEYATSDRSLEFHHPGDVGDDWRQIPCSECHAVPPL
jgi:nitrate/TMAO reductase-like tetraheme cytochrome c subunit